MTAEVSPPLKVEEWAAGGDGVVRWDGRVCFVAGAVPGDVVRFRVTQRKRSFAKGVVHELVDAGPDREDVSCPQFTRCGGCTWLNGSYDLQLRAKHRIVANHYRHLVDAAAIPQVVPAGKTTAYRRRAVFQVRHGEIGFYEGGSHRLVELSPCQVLDERLHEGYRVLSAQEVTLPDGRLSAAVGRDESGLDVVDVLTPEGRFLRWSGGDSFREIPGEAAMLQVDIAGIDLTYRVDTFLQNSLHALKSTAEATRNWLAAHDVREVWDCYGGVGLYGLLAAKAGRNVEVCETDPAAGRCWPQSLRHNHLSTATFVGEEASAASFLAARQPRSDVGVIVNPPRTGLSREVTSQFLRLKPPALLYISCDPATQARDVTALVEGGFTITSLQPYDFFPHTPHVECVVTLKCPTA